METLKLWNSELWGLSGRITSYIPDSLKWVLFLFVALHLAAMDCKAMTSWSVLQHSEFAKVQVEKEYEQKNTKSYLMTTSPLISQGEKIAIRAANLGVTKQERILPTVKPWEVGEYAIKTCRGIKTGTGWGESTWKCQSVRGRETMEDYVFRDGDFHSYGINLSKDYPELVIKYRIYDK